MRSILCRDHCFGEVTSACKVFQPLNLLAEAGEGGTIVTSVSEDLEIPPEYQQLFKDLCWLHACRILLRTVVGPNQQEDDHHKFLPAWCW